MCLILTPHNLSLGEYHANGVKWKISGNNANAGAPRGRVGQISHSVVLGTFNIGDQGESIGPDISQVNCFYFLFWPTRGFKFFNWTLSYY